MKIIKLLCGVLVVLAVCTRLYAQTVDDIRKRLGKESAAESVKEPLEGVKGFKQVNGKYYIVQVKDMSREEAEQILRHMDRLMEEFLNLYEYNFGTQKCFITVYGLQKDFDRLAKAEDLENAGAFSFLGPAGTVIGGIVGGIFGDWLFGGLDPSGAGYAGYDLDELYYDQYGYEWWK